MPGDLRVDPIEIAQLPTYREATQITGYNERTLRRWVNEGVLTAYRLGRRSVRLDLRSIRAERVGGDAV